MLYALSAEPLAALLRQNRLIKGVEVPGGRSLCSLFAVFVAVFAAVVLQCWCCCVITENIPLYLYTPKTCVFAVAESKWFRHYTLFSDNKELSTALGRNRTRVSHVAENGNLAFLLAYKDSTTHPPTFTSHRNYHYPGEVNSMVNKEGQTVKEGGVPSAATPRA
ncbi:hypothetical protein NQZ68_042160 [Dissostichus eleginoides]|nr:hypothetical protein NQZ68_042160 [Dissostichus eleginoides]